MEWMYSFTTKFLYPTSICVGLLLGAVLVWNRPRVGRVLVALGLGVLLVYGNGWLVEGLVGALGGKYISGNGVPPADCIVVSGGGTAARIRPRLSVEVSEAGDRVLCAARLFREGRAPWVVCTSGVAIGGLALRPPSEDMAELVEFLGVPHASILMETASGNTPEHARNLAPVLQERGFKRVLLVTSAMHMPGSMAVFRKYCSGVEFIAASTDFRMVDRIPGPWYRQLTALFPSPGNLQLFSEAAHEYVGIAYYWFRGWN